MDKIIDKEHVKPIPKIIRQVSDKPAVVTKISKEITQSIKNVGEIHLVLKNSKGELKEDRICNSIKKGG